MGWLYILVTVIADVNHDGGQCTHKRPKIILIKIVRLKIGTKMSGHKRTSNAAAGATVQRHDFKFRLRNMNVH